MVIIIRGACSVGKTSVARSLVHILPMSAHVECDERPWMSDTTLETLRNRGEQVQADLLNAWLVATASVFDRQGVHTVVDWLFPADAELQDLLRQLDGCHLPSHVFNLLCSPQEHLARDQRREREGQIGQGGIEYFGREGSWVDSPHGLDIDTTALAPEEVAKRIVTEIEANQTP